MYVFMAIINKPRLSSHVQISAAKPDNNKLKDFPKKSIINEIIPEEDVRPCITRAYHHNLLMFDCAHNTGRRLRVHCRSTVKTKRKSGTFSKWWQCYAPQSGTNKGQITRKKLSQ